MSSPITFDHLMSASMSGFNVGIESPRGAGEDASLESWRREFLHVRVRGESEG